MFRFWWICCGLEEEEETVATTEEGIETETEIEIETEIETEIKDTQDVTHIAASQVHLYLYRATRFILSVNILSLSLFLSGCCSCINAFMLMEYNINIILIAMINPVDPVITL